MQKDAELEKEQIGTLFVWLGALEGGFRRCWYLGGPPQKVGMPLKISCSLLAPTSFLQLI
jgi:hypothetical protein